MEDQVQPLGGKVKELASSSHRLDLQPVERRQRWIVGLECTEGDEIDASNGSPDTVLAQEPRERFHLRHFGHAPIMNVPSGRWTSPALAAGGQPQAGGDTPGAAAPRPQAMPDV